jgi:hypothetical protein
MKLNKSIFLGLVTVSCLFLMPLSCIREEFDPDKLNNSVLISPTVAAPLGFLEFHLDSMLTDSAKPEILEIHDDGTMTLRYRQVLFSDTLSDLFTFPDINEQFTVTNDLPSLPLNNLGDDTMKIRRTFPVDFRMIGSVQSRLDSLWINTLTMDIHLETLDGLNGQLQMTSQSFTSDYESPDINESLDILIPFDGTGATEVLDGYSITLENNQLIFNIELMIWTSDLILEQGGEIFTLDISFRDADYEALFGYLGRFRLDLPPQTINIDFFNSIIDGTFHFEEPVLKVHFTNSIGIPLKVNVEDFYVTTRFGEIEEITGESIPFSRENVDRKLIAYPDITQVGETMYDSLPLDLNNTNILDILTLAPRDLTFSAFGEINARGTDTVNFITKDSHYSIEVELILPLKGYAYYMVMMDTLEFDFTSFYDKSPEEINRLAFRVNFINGFPVEIDAQMYFVDENYNPTTSLFPETWKLVEAGEPRSDCDIEPHINDPLEVEFTRDKINAIALSKYVFIYARVSTPGWEDEEIVTLCNNHTFKAYIGIIIDAEVNTADYQ